MLLERSMNCLYYSNQPIHLEMLQRFFAGTSIRGDRLCFGKMKKKREEKQIKHKIKFNDSKEKSDTNCDCYYTLCANESSSERENKHARHKISSYKQIMDVISIAIVQSTAKFEKLNQYYDFG